MILFKVYVFFGVLSVLKTQTTFMPNLPMGAYRLIVSAIYQCDKTKDLPIKTNVYLSKKTFNSTEMKGNFTLDVPFEDSYILDVNFASWSLTGGWKPNSLVYVTNNACTQMKNILGNAWLSVLKTFNFSTTNCPLPVGIYKSTGFDTILFNDNNFPKVYFYGKYKFTAGILSSSPQEYKNMILSECKVQYKNTSGKITHHNCNKLNPNYFYRHKLRGCYNIHLKEPNAKVCSKCNIIKSTVLFVLVMSNLCIHI